MSLHQKIEEIERIETELRTHPRDWERYLRLALAYFEAGVFSERALQVYERAIDIRPDNPIAQRAMSICFLVQSVNDLLHLEEGEQPHENLTLHQYFESIAEILTELPDSADLIKALGDICLIQRQTDQALEYYDRAVQVAPNSLTGFQRSGEYAARMGALPPHLAEFLGQIMLSIGRPMIALKILHQSWLQFKQAQLADRLIVLLEQKLIPSSDAQQAHNLRLELCEIYLDTGAVTEAIRVFRSLDPERSFLRVALVKRMSRSLFEIEDYRGAFDCLSRIPVDDDAKKLLNEIAAALEKRGELDTAAYLLQFINRHDVVIQEAERLKAIEIERTAHRELGDFNYNNKRYDRAILSYLQALEMGVPEEFEILDKIDSGLLQIDRPDVGVLIKLGSFCIDLDNYQRATRYLRRAGEADPQNAEVALQLRKCYDYLLQRDPDSPEFLLQSAELHMRRGETQKAIQELEQAASFPERSREAHTRLVRLYLNCERYVDSLEMAKQLSDLSELQDEMYRMADALTVSGQLHRACEAAKLLAQCNPEYLDVRQRVRELEDRISHLTRAQHSSHGGVADQKMIELIGEIAIGRYKYIEKIGSGGMGIVHKVYDAREDCVVAMKILRDSLTSSKKAIERFFREARIAATLQHPNIVNILDYHLNQNHGQSYIAMEFVDGPSLRDILEERIGKTCDLTDDYIARNLYYAAQLCNALHVTHERGIIHRDIKPDNVMITAENVVKVTDFGIVHIEEATFTPTGALIGTPRYMSPEQVQGSRVDGRSDIYAVGIILYEMLVGSPPFLSGDVAYQHVHIKPAPIQDIHPRFPAQVDEIIIRCLAKRPEDRYQSVDDLKCALESVLRDLYLKELERLQDGCLTDHEMESSLDWDVE